MRPREMDVRLNSKSGSNNVITWVGDTLPPADPRTSP